VHSRDLFVLSLGRLMMMMKMGNQSRVRDFRRSILLFFRHFFYPSFGFRSSFSFSFSQCIVIALGASIKALSLSS